MFRIVQRRGAAVGSTPEPAARKTPMAGSANVANAPNTNPKAKLVGKQGIPNIFFLGNVEPSVSPSGIKPSRKPSIKNASPTITMIMPTAIIKEYTIGKPSTKT